MSDEPPKQLAKYGFLASTTVTIIASTMILEHKVNKVIQFGGILASLALIIFCFKNLYNSYSFIGLFLAGYIFFTFIGARSYIYEFHKTLGQIKCKTDRYLMLPYADKSDEKIYPFNDIAYLKVEQIRSRYTDSFKIKLVLQNKNEFELLSGSTLEQCMKNATIYRDFLEINEPIKFG